MIGPKGIRRIISKLTAKKLPEDIFIRQLRSLVIGEGMLHVGNPYLIDYALKNMPDNGCVVEIGSYGGLSTSLILYLLKKNDRVADLVNCDPWIYRGFGKKYNESSTIDGRDDITCQSFTDYLKQSFIRSMKFLNEDKLPYSFQLTSDDFFKRYNQRMNTTDIFGRTITLGSAISFAYIDGNHDYEYVKSDFENVDKYLLKSGFILFDDSEDGSQFGSTIFMKEMKKNKNYRLTKKNPNYLFEKIK